MNSTAEVLRRPLACCMSVKAKMAESGDFEDGDLKLPEGEEMKKTLFGIIFSVRNHREERVNTEKIEHKRN